ncbi:MAG: glycosyltransferase [Sulfitobacter sp.]
MHIAYILNSYPQPSHSFIRREICALEGLGHTVTRMAMRPGDTPLIDAQDLEEAGATHYVLPAGAAALIGATIRAAIIRPAQFFAALNLAVTCGRRADVGAIKHLVYLVEAAYVAQTCHAANVDHAHAHFGTNATTVAMLAAALGGPAYSFTVHGPEEFDAPVALSLGIKVARSKFAVAITSYGRSQLSRWAAPRDWEKIKVVHCGIEPDHFPAALPVPDGGPRFVAIGRLVEQKGQLLALDAMAELIKTHANAHLTLIGDGELRPVIEARIHALDLGTHVSLTGWADEAGILSELNAAQALLMPSFAEGLPMVIMEAMAAGRPVISTYIAGIPELVVPDKTGWLVPAGDAIALAEAMRSLADMPTATLTKMGKAGRTRVFARHDVEQEAEKLAAYFAD